MSLLLQYTRLSCSRVQFKENASLVLSLLKLLVRFSKLFLSWQLSKLTNSRNIIGGIFQLKALLFNSMLNQRHQSCRNRFPEVSQGQHYSQSSIIQNTGYSKGYIRQIHNKPPYRTNADHSSTDPAGKRLPGCWNIQVARNQLIPKRNNRK